MTKIAKHPSAVYSSIVSILIFTQQPLLPYLSRNPLEESRQAGSAPIANIEGCNYNIDENEVLHPWEHDGPFANPDNEGAIVQLIGALLNWKKGSNERDAAIISTLDIQVAVMFVILSFIFLASTLIKPNENLCFQSGAPVHCVFTQVLRTIGPPHSTADSIQIIQQ